MRNLFRVACALLVLACEDVHARTEQLTIVTPQTTKTFSISELEKKLSVLTVTIDDPVYKAKKTFDGFKLEDVLALAGNLSGVDEIIFAAKDGYSPTLALDKVKSKRGVIAFQEHGTKYKFANVRQGKALISPTPFYLVWIDSVGKEYPWSYQLVKIEFVSFEQRFPKLYPRGFKADSDVMKGFTHFKGLCLRCHSMNLEGGDLGPELNVPKNITEYWDRDVLHSFIKNPASFRARSKMPAFDGVLSSEQIDQVIEYLGAMKKNKQ